MQNRYFAYFSDFSHIGVDFRILICDFAYAWKPCQLYTLMLRELFVEIHKQVKIDSLCQKIFSIYVQ